MIAAGKKNRLKMKYPMKLWPFRPATRAGQNAIAIQITANKIHQRTGKAASSPRSYGTLVPAGQTAASAPTTLPQRARSAHHPGITPEGVILGDCDNSSMGRGVRLAGPCVPASTLIRTADAAPGRSSCLRRSARPSGSHSMAVPAGDGTRDFLPHGRSANAGQLRAQHTPMRPAAPMTSHTRETPCNGSAYRGSPGAEHCAPQASNAGSGSGASSRSAAGPSRRCRAAR
jgi:hypothetical protein